MLGWKSPCHSSSLIPCRRDGALDQLRRISLNLCNMVWGKTHRPFTNNPPCSSWKLQNSLGIRVSWRMFPSNPNRSCNRTSRSMSVINCICGLRGCRDSINLSEIMTHSAAACAVLQVTDTSDCSFTCDGYYWLPILLYLQLTKTQLSGYTCEGCFS